MHDNNLRKLKLADCNGIDWQWFECTQKLRTFALYLKGVTNSGKNIINLDKLLGNMPGIYFLRFDGFFLKFLESGGAILERLTKTMEYLNNLHFYQLGFYDLDQIRYVLRLIRSSPNLQHLYIIAMDPKVKNMFQMEILETTRKEDYFQSPDCRDTILNRLETVEINGVVGSWTELEFIKLLLASSPSLGWLKLSRNTMIDDPNDELRIA